MLQVRSVTLFGDGDSVVVQALSTSVPVCRWVSSTGRPSATNCCPLTSPIPTVTTKTASAVPKRTLSSAAYGVSWALASDHGGAPFPRRPAASSRPAVSRASGAAYGEAVAAWFSSKSFRSPKLASSRPV